MAFLSWVEVRSIKTIQHEAQGKEFRVASTYVEISRDYWLYKNEATVLYSKDVNKDRVRILNYNPKNHLTRELVAFIFTTILQ